MSKNKPVSIGVCGLGRAFVLTQRSLQHDPRVRLSAACAPRAESRIAFERTFPGARTYDSLTGLCNDPDVELVYIATPHQLHSEQVQLAAGAGKHVLVEKPITIALADARRMIESVKLAGVHAIVGPSHSFDAPVRLAADLLTPDACGQARMIQAFNYTDFLYRPRRPEELDTSQGGGVLFSQAVHQIDVIRRLAGVPAQSVYACTGNWDAQRNTEGAYQAIIRFTNGSSASISYSGYGHFDSDQWMDWAGELGQPKDPARYGEARLALKSIADPKQESALKSRRTFGAAPEPAEPAFEEHFGPVIVSTDQADLRLTAQGVHVYGHERQYFVPVPAARASRAGVVDAIVDALRHGIAPLQTLEWGLASLEICHAILESSRTGNVVPLNFQNPQDKK